MVCLHGYENPSEGTTTTEYLGEGDYGGECH